MRIDFYIGSRYNKHIGSRYNERRYKEEQTLSSQALTEAVYYILLSLLEPMHGYGIMQNVEKLSHGRVSLAAGTLYGAINTLLEKRWITALPGEKSSRKKEYQITDLGRRALRAEIDRLTELLENGKQLLSLEEKG